MPAITGLIRVMERAARRAGGKLRRDFGLGCSFFRRFYGRGHVAQEG